MWTPCHQVQSVPRPGGRAVLTCELPATRYSLSQDQVVELYWQYDMWTPCYQVQSVQRQSAGAVPTGQPRRSRWINKHHVAAHDDRGEHAESGPGAVGSGGALCQRLHPALQTVPWTLTAGCVQGTSHLSMQLWCQYVYSACRHFWSYTTGCCRCFTVFFSTDSLCMWLWVAGYSLTFFWTWLGTLITVCIACRHSSYITGYCQCINYCLVRTHFLVLCKGAHFLCKVNHC